MTTLPSFAAPSLARRALGLLLGTALALALGACFGSDKADDPTPAGGVPDALHYAFAAPDWKTYIPCPHLETGVDGSLLRGSTQYFYLSSASSRATYSFTFPRDSARMVAPANLGRHPIVNRLDTVSRPFRLALRLPRRLATDTTFLRSQAGLSADSYNEVVAIKYVRSTRRNGVAYATFDVKCRYALLAATTDAPALRLPVTGTTCIRFNTRAR